MSHLTHAGSKPRKWLPKVLVTLRIHRPVRYQDGWSFLAGGMAFTQDQHTEDLDALEEHVNVEQGAAAGVMLVPFPAPDVVADRHFRRTSLSQEAQHVLYMILDAPAEAMRAIVTRKNKQPTQTTIKNYLVRRGLCKSAITRVMSELADYTMEGSRDSD